VVRGEDEQTMLELANLSVKQPQNLGQVQGITFAQ
jgi:hypothetical protein